MNVRLKNPTLLDVAGFSIAVRNQRIHDFVFSYQGSPVAKHNNDFMEC